MGRLTKRVIFGTVVVLGMLVFTLLFWRLPWWLDGAHLRNSDLQPADGVVITGVRTALVALGAASIAGLGLYFTHGTLKHTRERDREQADLLREGQVTDRYIEAIKLLAEDGATKRLGGIYALERITKDSEKDHSTVVEVLAAFIREHAPLYTSRRNSNGFTPRSNFRDVKPKGAVQAALTVLGRRPIRYEKNRINLRNVDLRGADLSDAYLVGFDLTGSDLRGSDFSASHLHKATLRNTRLDGASFIESLMDECFLDAAQGSDVNFNSAVLRRATFGESNLTGIDFSGSDLWASQWTNAVIDGADFSSADLRFSLMMNTTVGGAVFKNANLSMIRAPGTDYPGCEFQGADLDGAVFIAGDLSGANGLAAESLKKALINPEVKLPEGFSGDPLISERIKAYEKTSSIPILRAESEGPQCCLDDSNLSHTVGLMQSIPNENERDALVSEIAEGWLRA
ncbi:pentapeptide repeat-containing protein [Streptomyces sp. NPDC055094]